MSGRTTKEGYLVGRRFGRLTVAAETDRRTAAGHIVWRCACSCGGTAYATAFNLRSPPREGGKPPMTPRPLAPLTPAERQHLLALAARIRRETDGPMADALEAVAGGDDGALAAFYDRLCATADFERAERLREILGLE